ncbi:hypothetical protein SAMN05446037_103414 [Anaerovirgula multivorans]|uniref:Uncharacterized protein n=1 Tax=Anaerovirgula multivorans TaxID=312168 RepID=A0A239J9E2_9FIRM|nr:hypothetical protein [Anaerovirgula multivorans]SNT02497.1 hypothetical protein SAMN05446037_103414 [Anaerovirgula multivorans]
MIKAYVVGISTHYENEDIEIRYRIYKDQELVCEKSIFQEFKKPLVVSHVALLTLLKELEKYTEYEITIVINDAALNEQIRGTSKTKNKDVLKMANIVREELNKFKGSVTVKDVSGNPAELMEWNDILQP